MTANVCWWIAASVTSIWLYNYHLGITGSPKKVLPIFIFRISVSEEDFDVQFAPESTGSYVMKETITGLQLSSLTVSMWLKNDKCDSKHTSFVYSTTDYDSEISFKLEGITAIQECKLSIIMKNYE